MNKLEAKQKVAEMGLTLVSLHNSRAFRPGKTACIKVQRGQAIIEVHTALDATQATLLEIKRKVRADLYFGKAYADLDEAQKATVDQEIVGFEYIIR